MVRLIRELDRKVGEGDRLEKNRDVGETPPLRITKKVSGICRSPFPI